MRYPSINHHHYSSLRNALRLLNLFSVDEPELQLQDMATKLEIGQSTAFRLVQTLIAEGFVMRDPYAKSYRLAASVLAMGHTIITKMDLCHKSIDILEELAENTGETAHIAVLKDDQALYLLKIDSSNPVHLLSHAGKTNPIHSTSTGQILLAYQAESIINKVMERELIGYTEKTITDPMKLKNELQIIRKKGYAVSQEELHKGVVSIAAPVKNKKGEIIAAVSIAAPISRINKQNVPKLTKQVQQTANEMTQKLSLLG